MRRSKRKKNAAETPASSRVPTIIAGTVREPQDEGSLAVTLTLTDTRIAMHADTLELGDWARGAVVVTPKADGVFVFAAEGDSVLFTPADGEHFMELLGVEAPKSRRRRSRRSKKRDDAEAPGRPIISYKDPAPLVPAAYEVSTPQTRDDPDESEQMDLPDEGEPVIETPADELPRSEPATDESGAATGPSIAASTTIDEDAPPLPSPVSTSIGDVRETAPPAAGNTETKKDSRWIRTLDTARRYGMFSLDRVPVDESLRGKEHRHTYDHRAAASSGPGARICTICGKIKR